MNFAVLTPALLQLFQTVLRRAGASRRRALDHTVSITTNRASSHTTLRVALPRVVVDLRVSACAPAGTFRLGQELFDICASTSREPLRFEPGQEWFLKAQWLCRNSPRQHAFSVETLVDDRALPQGDIEYIENPASLWTALREAVATTDNESTRYATDCLQLRGESGSIAATDTRQLLIQKEFTFPWTDNRLIPALPVLGCRELMASGEVGVGLEGNWIWFRNGPWSVAVNLETEKRFPEVDRIIPSADTVRSRLLLSAADRTFLQGELAALTPGKGEPPPVTVELNGHVILRSRQSPEQPATELTLSNSRLEGNPVTCLLKGTNLRRLVNLGFEQVNIQNGDIPLFCDDGRRQYVWMPLDSSQVLKASEGDLRISSPGAQTTHTTTETTSRPTVQIRRHVPMPSANLAVRAANEQEANTNTEPKTHATDPVAQVAALYEALRNTTAQCHTLIRTLKRQRREARLVQTTLASLRQLQEVA